jgi:hypothetical protein
MLSTIQTKTNGAAKSRKHTSKMTKLAKLKTITDQDKVYYETMNWTDSQGRECQRLHDEHCFVFENWFVTHDLPDGMHKVVDALHKCISRTEVRCSNGCIDFGALGEAITEVRYLTKYHGTFVEDVSWNSEYECLEVSIGS